MNLTLHSHLILPCSLTVPLAGALLPVCEAGSGGCDLLIGEFWAPKLEPGISRLGAFHSFLPFGLDDILLFTNNNQNYECKIKKKQPTKKN